MFNEDMTLILFRHAEKISIGVSDPPLTPRGENQAGKIIDLIELKKIPKPTEVWTSEKKRTQQTAILTVKHYNLKSLVVSDLNEIQKSESFEDFFRRIRRFQNQFKASGPSVLMAITHLDWIAQFLEILKAEGVQIPESVMLPWSSCQWGLFELSNDNWHFLKSERT